ncbi:MAG: Copper-translocating P-type ATPase [Parcubacteria group bacterium GW2011_GWB2_40_8]|nr:MAG: Copper-translocating P-type ATPase [Parcubacteria group bacterium GW2011_GWA2_40_143]KKR60468.1 MAG: Copper-translocating P-type ATPase [Parcubacteria group bacterium GW2011_GWC2_40_31]KKR74536.1 MAG: Copper-translocating P-type ATPase [Parcubacteria group bacterium GW2011_GWB2_40_8]
MSSHGSAKEFLNKFWIITALLVPLFLSSGIGSKIFGLEGYILNDYIQFIIASAVFWFGLVFFRHAWHEIKTRKYGMMTLVSLAVGSGYLFSVAGVFVPALEIKFYLEISTLIWVLMFGHYLEARSGAAAGNALEEIAKLLPKKARVIKDGMEEEVDVSALKEGDIVFIRPGEKAPADGEVIEGGANVNEALITGESKPVEKKKESKVVAGSICLDGSLTVKITRAGENSTIGQIKNLIAKAQKTKPSSQRLADKAAGVLTFVAAAAAVLALLIWAFVFGQPLVFAFTLAITVLVIACPHALGLAIPAVTSIATSLAAKNGIFIKDLSKLEIIKNASYVVFDKTGTLTEGGFGVTDIALLTEDYGDEKQFIGLVASVEKHSSHVIANAIVNYAREKSIELASIRDFKNIAGKGVKALVGNSEYLIGNKSFMAENEVLEERKEPHQDFLRQSKTVVFVAKDGRLIGLIALADKIRTESYEAVKAIKSMGIKPVMITGDNKETARNAAEALGIEIYFAEVLPEDKYKYIKKLQEDGSVVMMVGDGVNDAPALAQADIGVAIGAGTDVAAEAGDVVLTRSNPMDAARLIILSKKVYGKMIQNLIWALGYNVVAIPAAAGAFASLGFFLRPEIGAIIMSMSTVIVVANALTLKRIKL